MCGISIHDACAGAGSGLMQHAMSAGKHVVFGSVTKGMDVVKNIEGYGSSSGKTSKPIKIENSGQLS